MASTVRALAIALAITSVGMGLVARAAPIDEILDAAGDGAGNRIDAPVFVRTDAAGNVFVASEFTNTVLKRTPAGGVTVVIDEDGDGVHPMWGPKQLALDAVGNLYVSGVHSDNAFKVTPGGVVTQILGPAGDGAGNVLDRTEGVAVDGAGDVYVTGFWSNNVFKVTPGGVVTEIIDAAGAGPGQRLDGPLELALDAAGNLYVTGEISDNAFRIAPDGTITEIIDEQGDRAGQALNQAMGLAVESDGTAYVTGWVTQNAFKIAPGGAITAVLKPEGDGCHDVDAPRTVTLGGSAGQVFVGVRRSNNLYRIQASGQVAEIMDATGDGAGNALIGTRSVYVDGPNGYVTGFETDNVFRFDLDLPAHPCAGPPPPPPPGSSCDDVARMGCKQATVRFKGRLSLRDKETDKGDSFVWKWVKGEATTLAEFGDPVLTDHLSVCVYDERTNPPVRLVDMNVPPGGTCGGKPCWKALPLDKGYQYKSQEAAGGVAKVTLKPGASGEASVKVKGKGAGIRLPALPLDLPIRLQLQSTTGACWESVYTSAGVVRATHEKMSLKEGGA